MNQCIIVDLVSFIHVDIFFLFQLDQMKWNWMQKQSAHEAAR